MEHLIRDAKCASKNLLRLSDEDINRVLNQVADGIENCINEILAANALDVARMEINNPKRDRLLLTDGRIRSICDDMRSVAKLPSPKRIIDRRVRPNGLEITRVAVPFGLVGVIYEARPNVTADVFSLCFKSGNACILKGGHDADCTNRAIADCIHTVLLSNGIDPAALTLMPSTREAGEAMMRARGYVDVIIPRGSKALIDSVRHNASVPVIETGAGVCHCYVDATADIPMAAAIVNNAKTRRVSVCNALDCMIIHQDILSALPQICEPLISNDVSIYADTKSLTALSGHYPAELLHEATDEDYGREFLSYSMAIKTVETFTAALQHIARYGSGHSESIVSRNEQNIETFYRDVDAACVYANAPTSFTDGGQFGLGAEIGISTQKLHARGPMGLEELMTYKWLIRGEGQTRD